MEFTLSGPEARHHFGWVKGGKTRQILPGNMQDRAVIRAMYLELREIFKRARKGIP